MKNFYISSYFIIGIICCLLYPNTTKAQRAGTIGSIENFESNQTYWIRSARLSDDHVIVVYKAAVSGASATAADIFSRVGKVDTATKSITWGPVATITTNDNISPFVIGISETQAVIAYEYSVGVADIGVTRVITISDSTITAVGDTNQFSAGDFTALGGCHLGSGKIVIAYDDKENLGKGTAVIGNISGTSINFGATQVFSSTEVGPTIVKPISSTRFVMAYEDEGTTNDPAEALVVDVSGTTLTFGTIEQVVSSAYVSSKVGLAVLNSSTIVVAYGDDAASEEGMVRVGTISGSSITFGGSAVEFASNVNIVNDIYIEETTGDEFLIQYTGTVSSDSAYYLVAERSGNSFTFGDKVAYLNKQTDDQRILRLTDDSFVGTFTEEQNSDIGGSFVGTLPSAASPLVASAAVTSALDCNGDTDGQITASATGGTTPYTYSWNTGETNALETNLGAGTYSVTITDQNGTTDSASIIITESSALVASASVTSALDCNGDTDGQITGSATGGTSPFTYAWNTGETNALETNLGANTYSVTITDQNGCTDSSSVTISEPISLVSSASVTSALDCNGDTDGQITGSATGGTSPFTYSWNTGGTAALETGLGAGTYSITVTDQNGCTDSASTTVSTPTAMVASATVTNALDCNGDTDGQVTGSATGGTTPFTYSWNTGETNALETNLGANTYSVTITDQNGCTDSASTTVSNPTAMIASATVTNALDCNGDTDGQITGSATGGTTPFTYSWNTGETNALETNLGANTYSVTITDQNGCTDSSSVTISEPVSLVSSASVTSALDCNGDTDGQITGSATGGTSPFTYSWNTGETNALETNLGANTYSVTITDQNGCTDSSSVTISEPVSLVSSASVTNALDCNGDTDGQITGSATGGTTPFTYSWNTGGTAALETGLGAGTYSITVTDQNGCTDSASTTVSNPTAMVASATVTNALDCNGDTDGQITGSATGGTTPFTYSWNTGGTAALETGLGAGTYSITVTDQNGCTDSASTTVSNPTAMVASATVTNALDCNGDTDGQITGSATGGTSPFTYSWNTGETNALETNLGANTYSVTITDQNGCRFFFCYHIGTRFTRILSLSHQRFRL